MKKGGFIRQFLKGRKYFFERGIIQTWALIRPLRFIALYKKENIYLAILISNENLNILIENDHFFEIKCVIKL